MDLSTLKNAPGARRTRKRVGRGVGSGNGKTAGRGHKGQRSRSGFSLNPAFEGGQMPLNRRLPKRGFWHGDRHPRAIVNLDQLDRNFEAGAEVSLETAIAAGLARPAEGGLKVLGRGELTKPLVIKAHAVSAGARAKVEAAGGSVELLVPAADAAAGEGGR